MGITALFTYGAAFRDKMVVVTVSERIPFQYKEGTAISHRPVLRMDGVRVLIL